MTAATNCVTNTARDGQDRTDDDQDNADGPQDRRSDKEADKQADQTNDDHGHLQVGARVLPFGALSIQTFVLFK